MVEPTLLIAIIATVVILILILTYLSKKRTSAPNENEGGHQRPRAVPVLRGAGVEAPRRAGRNIRARMRAAAARPNEEDEDDLLPDDIALPDGKIGAKKTEKT